MMGGLLLQIMIVVLAGGLASAVIPPTNVSILCQNGTNVASWEHTGSKAVLFSATVKSYQSGDTLLQTNLTHHHFDMSSVTPPSGDVYYFYLVALEGTSTSEVVQQTFSYGDAFDSEVDCFMDFPRLHVRVEEERMEFSFFKPPLAEVVPVGDDMYDAYEDYYVSEPPSVYNHDSMQFEYSAITTHDKKKHTFRCLAENSECHGDILLKVDSIQNCTTLVLEGFANAIRYKSSQDFCSLVPEKGPLPIFLYVVISVIVLGTLVGLLLGTKKVAKTMIQNSLSDNTVQGFLRFIPAFLRSTPAPPTPLIQSTRESPVDSPSATPPDTHLEQTHFPIGIFASSGSDQPGDGYEAREPLKLDPESEPESYEGKGEDSGDDGYMQRERITGDALDSSRSSIIIEISPGDHVDGYGPC